LFSVESQFSTISFRTADAGTGHISMSASYGLFDVEASEVLVVNTEEGVDVRARNTVSLVGERRLGLTGILFEIEDAIHMLSLSDDIELRGGEVLMNVLSTGSLVIGSDGSASGDSLTVRSVDGITASMASIAISTQNNGDISMNAHCFAAGTCQLALQAQEDIHLEATDNMDMEAQRIEIFSANEDIYFESPNGRIVLDSEWPANQPIGNTAFTPNDIGVWFANSPGDGTFFLLPYRGEVLDGSGCTYDRELALADNFDGRAGLCFCEQTVWSCSFSPL